MTQTYHFIGIKGSGMSALALMLHQMGYHVQGSDVDKYYFTQRSLEQAGISILPFDAGNITNDLVLIAGNAFHATNNVELAVAEEKDLRYQRYHDFLGEFMKQFTSFGVAGAHGKTSTTGILAHVMRHIADTAYLIGDGTGRGSQTAEYFVFEADEYERHFKLYHPEYSIITNIDFDHPDYFTDISDVCSAFEEYANNVTKGLFVYGEDERLQDLTATAPIYYYGISSTNDFVACDIQKTTSGSTFRVMYHEKDLGTFKIPCFGLHNVMNATAVIAMMVTAGFEVESIRMHLMTFPGVKRRFTEKTINGTVIIDDFAHHPTEIVATLDAARQKYPTKDIVVIFQPHTFTRTIALLDEFAAALESCNSVYVVEIYGSAREVDQGQIKAQDLIDRISKPGQVVTLDNMSPLLDHSDAVYVFMGAGDVQSYEHAFEDLLASLAHNVQ